jgi:glycosyltransferase involved in cell wall biosynthesis
LRSSRPRILVLQWWTATTLHTYVVLAVVARLLGSRVVIEMHETQDPDEARYSIMTCYCNLGLRFLLRISHGCVVHSLADSNWLRRSYDVRRARVVVARHGPYDQYRAVNKPSSAEPAIAGVMAAPRPQVINLLFFGLIRPYKGLDYLLRVFNSLSEDEAGRLWLTIVGETWGDYVQPKRLIQDSPYRNRITFVNEYVPDEVAAAAFSHADVVILPYLRSSGSGTLHIAMSCGLPVVVSSVGGLPEAAGDYEGAIFIPPADQEALKIGIEHAIKISGQRFEDRGDWAETLNALRSAAGVQAQIPK